MNFEVQNKDAEILVVDSILGLLMESHVFESGLG